MPFPSALEILAGVHRHRLRLMAVSLAIALILLGCLSVSKGWIQINHPSPTRFPHRGIDISHHQGRIDWSRVSKHHLDFVVAKATEGVDHQDRLFSEHVRGALSTGHQVGAYHFYRMCREGLPQARNFLRSIQGKELAMGAALDLEYGGNCQALGSREHVLAQIGAFLDTVGRVTGKPVLIYATADFYDDWLQGGFAGNPIWIRDIWKEPRLENDRQWTVWQYSARGRLDGIEGFVDLNAMR